MSQSAAVRCILNTARSFIGLNEKDGSYREIIDLYNSHRPLPRGYAMRYDDPWCTAFVGAVSIACGLTKILPPECSAEEMIALYRAMGRWVEDDAYVPSPGDLVFFDWEDSGHGDNRGLADHVGIVCRVHGHSVLVIEGNAGDAVGFREFALDSRFIRGWARPNYTLFSGATIEKQ